MRYKFKAILLSTLLSLVIVTGCFGGTEKQATDTGRTARQANRAERRYDKAERIEYEKKAEERLEKLQGRLVELKATAMSKGGTFYAEHRDGIYKLRDLLRAERARLAVLKEMNKEEWLEFQEGFDMALDDLEKSFDNAAKDYNK